MCDFDAFSKIVVETPWLALQVSHFAVLLALEPLGMLDWLSSELRVLEALGLLDCLSSSRSSRKT